MQAAWNAWPQSESRRRQSSPSNSQRQTTQSNCLFPLAAAAAAAPASRSRYGNAGSTSMAAWSSPGPAPAPSSCRLNSCCSCRSGAQTGPTCQSQRSYPLNPAHLPLLLQLQGPRLLSLSLSPRRAGDLAAMNNLLTDSFELPRRDSSRDGDIEMGMHRADASDNLKDFLKKVDTIEGLIVKLTNLLHKLQTANEESKAVTKASAMKGMHLFGLADITLSKLFLHTLYLLLMQQIIFFTGIKQKMEKDIDEVGKIARMAKTKVDELEKDNLSSRQKPGCGKGSAVDRSREQTTGAVKKKLKERMDDFQVLRVAIHQEYRDVVERRVFTVTGKRPDEEMVDNLIETGRSEQIFQEAIQQQGRGQILDTVAEIQERHDAVRDLERKLLELQQIFMDMAVLVEAQGDMINNIETHFCGHSFLSLYLCSTTQAEIWFALWQSVIHHSRFLCAQPHSVVM
ncbi:hypothetical protein ABZP36_002398 [Zizania latifolia]